LKASRADGSKQLALISSQFSLTEVEPDVLNNYCTIPQNKRPRNLQRQPGQLLKINFQNCSIMSPSNNHSPRALDDQLLVDFPTRRRRPTVRFVPQCTVFPIRYTLTMISDKQELWYLKRDVDEMKLERTSDAIALARTLLSPSDEDLKEGGIHVRQAIGLEKAANPIEAQSKLTTRVWHCYLCNLGYVYPSSSHHRPVILFLPSLLNRYLLQCRTHKGCAASQDGCSQTTGREG
jgi:hypothetical protein